MRDRAIVALLALASLVAVAVPAAGQAPPSGPSGVHVAYGFNPSTSLTVMFTGPPAQEASVVAEGPEGEVRATADARSLPGTERLAYTAHLEDLTPGTTYAYRAVLDGTASGTFEVATAPRVGSSANLTIAAWGDHGIPDPANPTSVPEDDSGSIENVELARELDPDLHVVAGDVSYANGYSSTWDRYFDTFEPYLATTPYMTVPGNHERAPGQGFEQYDRRLRMPTEGQNRWYAVQVGQTLIVGLNSETACQGAPPMPSAEMTTGRGCEGATDPAPQQAQLEFLESTLTEAAGDPSIAWRVVFFHHTPYSSSSAHGSIEPLQEFWGTLFQEHGVDLVVTGHDHTYQRTWPIVDGAPNATGVTYVVAGMGGDSHYAFENDRPDWLAYRDNDHWGTFLMDVGEDRLEGRYVTLDGTTRDRFVLDEPRDGNARITVNGTGPPIVPGEGSADGAPGDRPGTEDTPGPGPATVLGAVLAVALAVRRRRAT